MIDWISNSNDVSPSRRYIIEIRFQERFPIFVGVAVDCFVRTRCAEGELVWTNPDNGAIFLVHILHSFVPEPAGIVSDIPPLKQLYQFCNQHRFVRALPQIQQPILARGTWREGGKTCYKRIVKSIVWIAVVNVRYVEFSVT